MSLQATQSETSFDWEEVIMDIQTHPGEELCGSHWLLYAAIYGVLSVAADNWLEGRRLSSAEDGALVAIGLDKIFQNISKFNIPNDHPSGIGKAFKAWCVKCCKNEWSKYANSNLEDSIDPMEIQRLDDRPTLPLEKALSNQESAKTPSRSDVERKLMRKVLEDELDQLPPTMKDALLDSEDLKSVENPNARGKKGEAASIASKYGYTPNAVRTRRSRLLVKVQDRFEKEAQKL